MGPPLNKPYDPKEISADTWFDPTGKTKYDRVVIQLYDASHAGQHVVAQLEGGGCGAASIVAFREPSDPEKPKHYGMSGLVACVRGGYDKITLRFTVAPKELSISGGVYKGKHVDNVLEKVGADGWDCECPVPTKGAGWLKGWVTANGWVEKTPTAGTKFLKVSVRWEEPEDVGWDRIIGGDGNYLLIPKGMEKAASGWEEKVFDLHDPTNPRAKAVLTYKIKPGNTKMLYWLPGRNDLFMHYAAAEAFLEAGYDVFVMEHRRLGRANRDSTFRDFQLISHTTDLKIYMEEFDKGLAFARSLNPGYQRAVLYAHSTGGLEASVWLRERGPDFAAVVLNSPFLDWGNEGLMDRGLNCMGGCVLYPIVKCVFGGDAGPLPGGPATEPGRYGACLWMQHPAVDQKLRNSSGLGSTVTVGWARACTLAQNALNKSQPATTLPTLLLTTPGDSVLQTDELQEMISAFSSDNKIKSIDFCRHDMLLSYDDAKNKEVVLEMIAFLKAKEKEAWKQA